jgi:hypothetical protein
MDPIIIISIIAGLVLFALISFMDDALEKLLSPIFRLIGLQSSSGPIDVVVDQREEVIVLTISNKGKGKAKMATVQIIDGNGKKFFPIPYMEASEVSGQTGEKEAKECRKSLMSLKIEMGKERTIFLNPIELEGCNLSTLGVLDMHGKFWQASNS